MIFYEKFKTAPKIPYDQVKLNEVCSKYGISLVVLHGSQARGFSRNDSDVDIALLGEGRVFKKKYFEILRELSQVFGEQLDVVILNNAESMIVHQVALNGIVLYQKKEGFFSDFKTTAVSRYQDAFKFRQLEKYFLKQKIS